MKKTVVFLMTVLFLSGCAGAGVIHPNTDTFDRFSLTNWKSISKSDGASNPTKREVKDSWGAPDKISVKGNGSEVWRYHTGLMWIGIVPMIGIGIPIAIPIWKNGISITFDGNEATKAKHSFTTWSGGYFGPKDEGRMEYGFHLLED